MNSNNNKVDTDSAGAPDKGVGCGALVSLLRKSADAERAFGNQHADLLTQAADTIEKQTKAIAAVVALIGDSYGVAGLHLNGDVAPWSELREGGRYEGWLIDFDAALANSKAEPRAQRE